MEAVPYTPPHRQKWTHLQITELLTLYKSKRYHRKFSRSKKKDAVLLWEDLTAALTTRSTANWREVKSKFYNLRTVYLRLYKQLLAGDFKAVEWPFWSYFQDIFGNSDKKHPPVPLGSFAKEQIKKRRRGRPRRNPLPTLDYPSLLSLSARQYYLKHEPETAGPPIDDRKDESAAGGGDLGAVNLLGGDSMAGICDDVSIPLSPQQFLTEEPDNSTADPTNASQRPESYKLRHNNHLSLVLESLAGDESFMDVTLTAQGKAIKAHKSVLSAVSPYFRGVLKENPCQHPIIIMPRDIKFEELHSIISYVYKGEMTVAAEDLASLLKTAEVLQVTGLTPSEAMNGGLPGHIQNLAKSLSHLSSPSTSTAAPTGRRKASEKRWTSKQKVVEETQEEIQARLDPTDFLNADMTLIKEEVDSDADMNEDPLSSREQRSEKDDLNPPGVCQEPYPLPEEGEEKDPLSQDPIQDPLQFGDQHQDQDSTTSLPSAFVCPHCLETHRPFDSLNIHLRLKHPTKASHACKCGRVFLKMSLFTDHQKKCEHS